MNLKLIFRLKSSMSWSEIHPKSRKIDRNVLIFWKNFLRSMLLLLTNLSFPTTLRNIRNTWYSWLLLEVSLLVMMRISQLIPRTNIHQKMLLDTCLNWSKKMITRLIDSMTPFTVQTLSVHFFLLIILHLSDKSSRRWSGMCLLLYYSIF